MGKKRKAGEGTLRLRKDGRWEGRIVVDYDENGKPKTKNITAKTKASASPRSSATRTASICTSFLPSERYRSTS